MVCGSSSSSSKDLPPASVRDWLVTEVTHDDRWALLMAAFVYSILCDTVGDSSPWNQNTSNEQSDWKNME